MAASAARVEWSRRTPGERRTLLLGAAAVVLLLGYLLAWKPLADARDSLRMRVAQDAAELEWMRQAAPALASGANATPALEVDRRSLLARADAGAREAGLGPSLLRVDPVSSTEVRMVFSAADFDALIGWIEQFAGTGAVVVTELSVQRSAGVGLVEARLALREAGR